VEAVHAKQLQLLIEAASRAGLLTGSATIRLQAVVQLDTYGAWLLERFVRTWRARGIDMRIFQLPARHDGLLAEVRTTHREAAPGLVAAFLRDDGFRRVGLVRHGADGPRDELGAGLRMPFPTTSSLAPTSSRGRERPPGCSLDQAGTYAPDPNSVRTACASNARLNDTVATP